MRAVEEKRNGLTLVLWHKCNWQGRRWDLKGRVQRGQDGLRLVGSWFDHVCLLKEGLGNLLLFNTPLLNYIINLWTEGFDKSGGSKFIFFFISSLTWFISLVDCAPANCPSQW